MVVSLDQMRCWPMSAARPDSCPRGSPLPRDKCFSGAQGGTPTSASIVNGVEGKPFPLCFCCDKKPLQWAEQLLGNEKQITNANSERLTEERLQLRLQMPTSALTGLTLEPPTPCLGPNWRAPGPPPTTEFSSLNQGGHYSTDVKRIQGDITIVHYHTLNKQHQDQALCWLTGYGGNSVGTIPASVELII